MIDTTMSSPAIPLDADAIRSMKSGAIFNDNTSRINSLDYWVDGRVLCTASNDDMLTIIDAVSGTTLKSLLFKEKGISHVSFAHDPSTVLCASNRSANGTIMYHSFLDNKFLRCYSAQRDKICSLTLSPIDDSFMSCSHDSTVCLWDLRSSTPQAILTAGPSPCAQYDPKGLIFACTTDPFCVRLFDTRSYKQGPFASFRLSGAASWHQIEFSPDGALIALASRSGTIVILDSFSGEHRLTLKKPCSTLGLETAASFSPDGKFIASGSEVGAVHVWESSSGQEVAILKGGHTRPVMNVKWNPKMAQIASAAENTTLWIPGRS